MLLIVHQCIVLIAAIVGFIKTIVVTIATNVISILLSLLQSLSLLPLPLSPLPPSLSPPSSTLSFHCCCCLFVAASIIATISITIVSPSLPLSSSKLLSWSSLLLLPLSPFPTLYLLQSLSLPSSPSLLLPSSIP